METKGQIRALEKGDFQKGYSWNMIGCEVTIVEVGYMGIYYINLFTFVYG